MSSNSLGSTVTEMNKSNLTGSLIKQLQKEEDKNKDHFKKNIILRKRLLCSEEDRENIRRKCYPECCLPVLQLNATLFKKRKKGKKKFFNEYSNVHWMI